jgi:hypothetical protein
MYVLTLATHLVCCVVCKSALCRHVLLCTWYHMLIGSQEESLPWLDSPYEPVLVKKLKVHIIVSWDVQCEIIHKWLHSSRTFLWASWMLRYKRTLHPCGLLNHNNSRWKQVASLIITTITDRFFHCTGAFFLLVIWRVVTWSRGRAIVPSSLMLMARDSTVYFAAWVNI